MSRIHSKREQNPRFAEMGDPNPMLPFQRNHKPLRKVLALRILHHLGHPALCSLELVIRHVLLQEQSQRPRFVYPFQGLTAPNG